jgi:flavin prenyltransferase
MSRRIVVGVTGATGAVYAVRLLARLKESGCETHLVASPAGVLNVHHELGLDRSALEALADRAYHPSDIGAAIASGSFATDAMVVAPCSMKTLASIAHGLADNLLARAADVTLASEMGAIVFPPLPAFYHRPQSIDELVGDSVERVLALLGVEAAAPKVWRGL